MHLLFHNSLFVATVITALEIVPSFRNQQQVLRARAVSCVIHRRFRQEMLPTQLAGGTAYRLMLA